MSAGGATSDRQEVAAGGRIWPADPFPQRDQQARRFPVLAPTKPSTPQNGVRSTQRYDAVAPPRNKPSWGGWLARAFSTSPHAPIARPEEEQPLIMRPSAPACPPSAQEDVTVMQQSQAQAWRVLGHRFHIAHGSRSSHHRTSFEHHRTRSSPLRAGGVAATRPGRIGPIFSRQVRRVRSEQGR